MALAIVTTNGKAKLPKHLDYLNRKLLEFAAPDSGLDRMMVFMPPRHGKSETVSRWFPAWYLLNFPDKRVMLASYEASFAAGWGSKVRDIFNLHCAARGLRVRPNVAAKEWWEIDKWDTELQTWVPTGGGMYTAGVRGGLTGKGGDMVIIDDPIKNAEESLSPTIRKNNEDWYLSTLYTRLEPGSKLVIIETRWHEDDLAGKRLEEERLGGPEHWEVINFPALAEENDALGREPGEALWPERFDAPKLRNIEKVQGAYWFSAMYQQRPIPLGKGQFQQQWLGRYEIIGSTYVLYHPDGRQSVWAVDQCIKFSTVDLATSIKQTADYTVISTWALTPNHELILVDVYRAQMEGPDHVAMLQSVWQNHQPVGFWIEQAGFQLSTIQTALRAGLPVMPIAPKGDKLERSISAAVRMKAGYYFFPKGTLYAEEEKELWRFPGGGHDDFVDTVSYSFHVSNDLEYAGNLED